MTTERKPYAPLVDDEIDDAKLDKIARDKGIGTLVIPSRRRGEGRSRQPHR